MAENDLPTSVYLYRDLNGSLVVTEDLETIPDRKIGADIGHYYLRYKRKFSVVRRLHPLQEINDGVTAPVTGDTP